MPFIAFRFALAMLTISSGCALLVISRNPERISRDPALALFIIPLIPELLYTVMEAVFLIYALLDKVPSSLLWSFSEIIQFTFGVAYIHLTYESWRVNGLSGKGYIPLRWIIALTVVNYLIFTLRFVLPSWLPTIQIANKSILGGTLLYAGVCAVIARSKKKDFFPATKAVFWMAFLGLIYIPFVGLADMFSPTIKNALLVRPMTLQLFPIRELIIIILYTLHLEPFYSRYLGGNTRIHEPLSNRESEIAGLIKEGKSNTVIAAMLHVSPATVKTHVRNILQKQGGISRERFLANSGKKES